MNEEYLLQIEALIFASQRPLSQMELLTYLSNNEEKEVNGHLIADCLEEIQIKYNQDIFPFELKESGGGYQFLTKKKYHPLILQLNGDKFIKKLSSSAMETLSIIAYKQPVTKLDIELIRGVSSDYSIQRLLEKELIFISGRKEDSIGKPLLYCTTKSFMDYLGINSPMELPKMQEILATETFEPSSGKEAQVEMKQTLSSLN